MMKIDARLMVLLAVAMLLIGCASGPKAPLTATGEKYHISVFSDRGDPNTLEEKQWGQRNEVGDVMEPNMLERLRRSGYDAVQISSRDAYQPGAGRYLLAMKIMNYAPGSAAARYWVGFGAGAASLEMHYDFIGDGPEPILSWDDGVGTSQHWSRLANKLNANAVIKITDKLQQGP